MYPQHHLHSQEHTKASGFLHFFNCHFNFFQRFHFICHFNVFQCLFPEPRQPLRPQLLKLKHLLWYKHTSRATKNQASLQLLSIFSCQMTLLKPLVALSIQPKLQLLHHVLLNYHTIVCQWFYLSCHFNFFQSFKFMSKFDPLRASSLVCTATKSYIWEQNKTLETSTSKFPLSSATSTSFTSFNSININCCYHTNPFQNVNNKHLKIIILF